MAQTAMQEQARVAFLTDTLKTLLGQDSPTGFTENVVTAAEGIARELGFETRRTNKGNLIITVPGREDGRKVGLCAHVDTLGLMVRSVTSDGMLMVTKVGGPLLPTLDGEYCRIYTREGKVYTGTVLSLSPSAHVQDDAATRARDEKNMAVRIDEKVRTKEDVEAPVTLAGDTDATYTLTATDKADNTAQITVTMKPIASLAAPLEGLTPDNVTSEDRAVLESVQTQVEQVLNSDPMTEDERAKLEEIQTALSRC